MEKNNPINVMNDTANWDDDDTNELDSYGSSIYTETDVKDLFPKTQLSDEDIEKSRNELKEDKEESRVKEKIVRDANSDAIIHAPMDKEDEPENVSEIVNKRDIKGKTLSNSGISLIQNLLKNDLNDDEYIHIKEFFESISINHNNESLSFLESIPLESVENGLGKRITNEISKIVNKSEYRFSNNETKSEEYSRVIRNFLEQLYSSYNYIVEYNDDISELAQLSSLIAEDDKNHKLDDMQNIKESSEKISAFLEKLSSLDERDKKMKPKYNISDTDIYTVSNIKECLDTALSFKLIYDKVDVTAQRTARIMRNKNEIFKTIDEWIIDIKNDSTTLYTFPVSSMLSIEESRSKILEIFYSIYIFELYEIDMSKIYNEDDESNNMSLDEYLIDNKIASKNDIYNIKTRAVLMLYYMATTFKVKKLNSSDEYNSNRRILSYTLNIISKLDNKIYKDNFIKISDYIYNAITNN